MTAKIEQMTAHIRDLSPIAEQVHSIMLEATRQNLAKSPIRQGESLRRAQEPLVYTVKQYQKPRKKKPPKPERLGPSLIDPKHPDHFFQFDKTKRAFQMGTYVWYVKFYQPWRKEKRLGPMISLKKKDREQFAQLVVDYVLAEEEKRGITGQR